MREVIGGYVQYGCHWSAPSGWRGFDASPKLRLERLPLIGRLCTRPSRRYPENVEYGDIVLGLPVPDDSCAGVYCSHVLEHLSVHDFRAALRNTHRMLADGGVFRLVLPDLERAIKQYNENRTPDASLTFMRTTGLGREHRPRGILMLLRDWFGNSQHLWMWDYMSIQRELSDAGFVDIRRAYFGDSSDTMFKAVEDVERWQEALGVESKKRSAGLKYHK